MTSDSVGEGLIVVPRSGTAQVLSRLRLGKDESYDEAWLRDLVFSNPGALPLRDIDPLALLPLPVCTELDVGVGRLDALFVDERGRLTLVECKLWRNPEARRRVVAQVLDYAAEMTNWSYGDLQRQVARRLKQSGDILFGVARRANPRLDEAAFVDGVTRGLREGDFTLLVLGDGIREETYRLAEYLADYARLRFRFGLVEIAPFQLADGTILLHPRVRAQTDFLPLASPFPQQLLDSDGEQALAVADSEEVKQRATYMVSPDVRAADRAFWTPFLADLRLDDPEQVIPREGPGHVENRRFRLPMRTWITAWRSGSRRDWNGVGVQFRTHRDATAVWRSLARQRAVILAELPDGTEWQQNRHITTYLPVSSIHDGETWPDQRRFLHDTINRYVNALRPRLKRLEAK